MLFDRFYEMGFKKVTKKCKKMKTATALNVRTQENKIKEATPSCQFDKTELLLIERG